MRKIARHAVTVYLDFLCRRALGVGISVRETPIPQWATAFDGQALAHSSAAVGQTAFSTDSASGAGAFKRVSGTTRAAAAKSVFMAVSPMG
jgi:hypothetical protein